ncbi:TetR/AcrR family transcriptional regulator [Streptomyces sp. NBC_00006]|uniref:TetR/AcrR family transcriptional regulator n=1 Tax=unclassified Streptomyces TaxID=2593676 RepID=UPI002254C4A0|nr:MULTISPECIES: TetR/AcrR family transcriptional regulator [unclassified Streptomyces]MCX4827781.1 TetR/AcrR family transcriptional regulator [Streptomyces sp. NBC_01016]MCX5532826.1 TetR/AcrR family transcriptional regulator [Streptomyces sp. NBC_00006]
MRTTQRKAQEVAERDQKLVYVALDMVCRDGFHNLTLGKLADEAGYSKGTVYNHFTCREDLLIELSAESARRQLRYFQAIADLPWGGARAVYGMTLAYMRHAEVAPVLFECSITARTDAVCKVASEERLKRRDLVEAQMSQVVGYAVERSVAEGSFGNAEVEPAVAVDALRAYILGYAAMHLLSRRFLWSGEEGLDARLKVMTSMIGGLGWTRLPVDDVARLHREVAGIVDPIAAQYAPEGHSE